MWAACPTPTSRSAEDAWKDKVASPFPLLLRNQAGIYATVWIGLPSEPAELVIGEAVTLSMGSTPATEFQ